MSGGAGYQPSPAADGAIQLGDGLGGHVVPLQPCVPTGQKLLYKVVAGKRQCVLLLIYTENRKQIKCISITNVDLCDLHLTNFSFFTLLLIFLLLFVGAVFMVEQQS